MLDRWTEQPASRLVRCCRVDFELLDLLPVSRLVSTAGCDVYGQPRASLAIQAGIG